MIVKDTLPDETFEAIMDQIGRLLPRLLEQQKPMPERVELRESFGVWTLRSKDIESGTHPGASFHAREAGYWHHQILFDGRVQAWAESDVSPTEAPRVREVTISPLAKKIDDAIEWVESPERDWVTSDLVHVQLLALPSLLIYTFRLVEPRKVYVIDAFPEFVGLRPGQLLDEGAFLQALYIGIQSQEEKYGDRSRSR